MIKVLYFASLRDRIGTTSEDLELPPNAATISDILQILRSRKGAWADTFDNDSLILTAVNQEMAGPDEVVRNGDEIAFFPPVTGG